MGKERATRLKIYDPLVKETEKINQCPNLQENYLKNAVFKTNDNVASKIATIKKECSGSTKTRSVAFMNNKGSLNSFKS